MKNLAILFFLIIFSLTVFGQTQTPTPKKSPKPAKTVVPKLDEKQEFEKAEAIANAEDRIKALQEFIKNFPESGEAARAQGLIIAARAVVADEKLQAGDVEGGIEMFKLALQEAPTPIPDELFTKVILGFPISLYSRNQRGPAFEMVKQIEEKVGANASQILDLAKFFINVQYGTEAIRLAKRSTEIAPDSATGFLTLAIANQMNFQLEDAANAYTKAVELDPKSVTNKISLAEMKRALGKSDEALVIYREMLAEDSANAGAQTGLVLSLFDAGKIKEAEAELQKSLEATPNNGALLSGAAYWYAAHNENEKAIEYSQKAISLNPRDIWSYISQARALLAQNKPLEAEKTLLLARRYGDIPTLDYELATARLAAGLYREAAEILKRNFTVNKEGQIETYLGNRILADAGTFTELLSLERRIALFEMKAADTEDNTNKLKELLAFNQKLEATDANEEELAEAADEFAKGTDNMRLHRQLYAANRLLDKKVALPKVLELMKAEVGGADTALNVPNPATAVLAEQIYGDRQYAITQNLVIVDPQIPRPVLSAILRGRIEDTVGWAYFQQNNTEQSVIHLKRALSVLPEKSAFSRASLWRLGEALQADGKEEEALEAYIKGYDKDFSGEEKRAFIEKLYIKVNGNTDGLEARIGPGPTAPIATTETKPTPNNTDNVKTTEPTPTPEVKTEPSPTPKTEETPQTTTENKTEPNPSPTKLPETLPAVTPDKTPEPSPQPTPTETPKTEVQPTPTPEPSPTPQDISNVKTENVKLIPPSPQTNNSKSEEKPANPTPTETPKPLFEPVIISVGKTEAKTDAPKTENTEPKPTEEKPSIENVSQTETEAPKTETETPKKPVDEKILSGEYRPRIIITENTGNKTITEEIKTCKLRVNQENLSLLNGGGSLGVEVSFEGEGDFRNITAKSSSPEDVEVRLDVDVGATRNIAYFVIKTISTKTGAYTVTFEAPCGKKEILVRVR